MSLIVGTVSNKTIWDNYVVNKHLDCDIVELRLDLITESVNPSNSEKPVLLTIRSQKEGGQSNLSLKEQYNILNEYISKGNVKYIDLELDSLKALKEHNPEDIIQYYRNKNIQVILSKHYFEEPPSIEELEENYAFAEKLKDTILKVAYIIKDPKDLNLGIKLLEEKRNKKIAIMGMGSLGASSRILYSKLGSYLIYGYIGKESTVSGQLPVQLLKALKEYI